MTTVDATLTARSVAQWLTSQRPGAQPVDVVRHLVAIQAQLPSAAGLAIRARSSGTCAADVVTAQGGNDLIRTWLFRGTLHLVAAEDVDWLLELLRPTIIARSARRRSQLGLDDAAVRRAADVIAEALASGQPHTRAELFDALSSAGIDPAGQRGIHLIRHAALSGAVCFGPHRGRESTWVARVPRVDRRSRSKALAELARRYRAGYGPTDPRDLAAWAGLPAVDARQAWSSAALPAPGPSRPRSEADHHDERQAGHEAAGRLLPHFDPYLLGYRTRESIVPTSHAHAVWTGGGFVMPTVVSAGQAVATWEMVRRPSRLLITVRPFGHLEENVRAAIADEVADIGRFLSLDATWTVGSPADAKAVGIMRLSE